MQTEEFINRVHESGQIADRPTARRITFATIEVLCMHLSAEQTHRMASQLPAELSEAAHTGRQQAAAQAAHVSLDDFYALVAVRAGMDARAVRPSAQAVIEVFKQAITRGEFADVAFDLPPEINTLMAS